MFILVPIAMLFVTANVQEGGSGDALETTVGKCAPEIDPKTGQMYPLCRPAIGSRFDLESLDISTDAYERGARLARREGRITEDEFKDSMARVRSARDLYVRSAVRF